MDVKFAEWLAENHFRLVNVKDKVYYWVSESYGNVIIESEELFKLFKNESK